MVGFTQLPFCVSFPLFRSQPDSFLIKRCDFLPVFNSSFHSVVVLLFSIIIYSIILCFPYRSLFLLIRLQYRYLEQAFIYNYFYFSKRQDAPKVQSLAVATHTSFMEINVWKKPSVWLKICQSEQCFLSFYENNLFHSIWALCLPACHQILYNIAGRLWTIP